MNEREYFRLKRQIEEDYKNKLSALETVWGLSNDKKPTREPREAKEVPNGRSEKGKFDLAVAEFVSSTALERFTAKDVEEWISKEKSERANRTTISHKLRQLAERGELTLTVPGKGRRAAVYALVASRQTAEDTAKSALIDELKSILADQEGFSAASFREDVLQFEFGVNRLVELESDKITELIARYKK